MGYIAGMRYRWIGTWLLLLLVSCEKTPTKPLVDIQGYTGTFTGRYFVRTCQPPFGPEHLEDGVRAELVVLRPEFLGLSLRGGTDSLLWDLECRYIGDSLFYVDPFLRADTVWHGNLVFADSVYLSLARRQPPCMHLGDTISSVIFRAAR
jgi:hypothetical protein